MTNSVQTQLHEFSARRQAIKENRDWSAEGQKRQLAIIDNEQAAYRQRAYTFLRIDLNSLRGKAKKLDTRRKEIQEEEAKKWDYNRLTYIGQAVQATIAQTNTAEFLSKQPALDVLAAEYKKAQNSGDRHLARAWAEIGSGVLHDRYGESDLKANGLARKMKADLAALLTTPELQATELELQNVADQALELIDVINETASFYGFGGVDSFGVKYPNEFTQLLDNVSVTQTGFEAETGRRTLTVDLGDIDLGATSI